MSIRHYLTVTDLTAVEQEEILNLAQKLKKGPHGKPLEGKTVALIFSKPSTRTRVSFSVGIHQLGGMPLYLSEQDLQMRKSESIEDTARVLSRYVDAIVVRTFAQKDIVDLAGASSVPVINALTDEHHPCQALADVLTLRERFSDLRGRKVTYLGDGNNVAASLAEACALSGVDICLCVPKGCDLPAEEMHRITSLTASGGSKVEVQRDPATAAEGASALYTDVWISMGQDTDRRKTEILKPYQIDERLLEKALPEAIVMHCLPAHRGEEITSGVMDGPQSVVFDQAENRLPAQKALLFYLLGGTGGLNKRQRQQLINSILRDRSVDSQQELAEALAAEGCEVTQATVSRDLKEMGLLKGRDSGGQVRYVSGAVGQDRGDTSNACSRMLSEFGRGIHQAQNLLVMRCDPGAAPGLGRVVDELEHEAILGCVAGDDTVIVVCSDNQAAGAVGEYLRELGG